MLTLRFIPALPWADRVAEPVLLPVEKLIADGSRVLLELKTPSTDPTEVSRIEPRGLRFVAVRGIFDMKQQIENMQKALHLATPQEASRKTRFWDFELQRQTAVAGNKPWPDVWEVVDMDAAVKLLKSVDFDFDVVAEKYRDAVFTMPLPYRVTGSWARSAGPNGVLATHPQIERLLSDEKVEAASHLQLIRFLDFSVVPGNAYHYRVRLKLLNPNADRAHRELRDVTSGEGRYRFTPWSGISTPALVQNENEVYVAEVSNRHGVSVDAYQWMTETGSYVDGRFEGLWRADRIASWTRRVRERDGGTTLQGGVTTRVLRPSAGTFMEEQIDFVTPYTLLGSNRETLLDPDDHPDLELTTKQISTTLQEIVVVNRFGDLVRVDTVSQSAAYETARRRMAHQERLWSHLKGAGQPEPSAGQ